MGPAGEDLRAQGPRVHEQAALKQLDLVKADQAKLRLDKDPCKGASRSLSVWQLRI